EEMSRPRRARLHRQAGEAMERLYTQNLGPHLAELAHHFCVSAQDGDLVRTLEYARQAASRALSLTSYEEAARLWALALQALDVSGALDQHEYCEVLLELADARRRTGELQSAMDTF